MRLLSGELRQGAQEGVVAEAVAKAAHAPAAAVRQAAMLCGDLGKVARAALVDGPQSLSKYAMQLFRPIEPMLASPAESVSEAMESFGEAAFELKLDGARIQVHKSGGRGPRVFARASGRDLRGAGSRRSGSTPDGPRVYPRWRSPRVATRRNAPLPFQETMRRFGRRSRSIVSSGELPLTPFFFDCLFIDGRPLDREPQRDRFAALSDVAGELSRSRIGHQ